jgi:TolB-like protein/DNA-binding winged helix-turn-helix (wHTH) protein/Tfp pilus assembly protein PilF
MKYSVGDLTIDTGTQVVSRDGARIALPKLSYDLLLVLVRAAPNLVSLDELMRLVWPGIVVSPETVSQRIKLLRDALGDDPREPRYIAGLRGRGYQMVAAVKEREADTAASVTAASGVSRAPAPPSHPEPAALPEAALAAPEVMRSGHEPAARDEVTSSTATTIAPARRPRLSALALIGALAVVALLAGVYALWRARSGASVTSVRVEAPSQPGLAASVAAFSPPPHSIAVLPFVNISGDKEQEYFSDGLTEELLNSLLHIDGLQVAARTSSFTFREHPDITDVAHKLNVATVLEGSVRRSGHTVRVTAQLNDAVTGFHLWSNTYDRDLSDVLKLQTEIATAVAEALRVTLLGDVSEKIELGGTRNPAAFDAYLRAAKAYGSARGANDVQSAINGFGEAIRLDPHYALALAARSLVLSVYGGSFATGPAVRETFDQAQGDARQAIAVAPDLAEAHLAFATSFEDVLEFNRAREEYTRAKLLAPGNARVLQDYGIFAVLMGETDAGLTALRRAVVLDPLNRNTHLNLGDALVNARRFPEAIVALQNTLALDPELPVAYGIRGLAYYAAGDLQGARGSCEAKAGHESLVCLAMTYQRLGRQADAEAAVAKLTASLGDAAAYRCAQIYAQWGKLSEAVRWLDTALRMRNPGLESLKTDPFMDPVRQEPRFQAIERELKFPS